MGVSDLVYGVYERRIKASLDPERIPRHVGIIIDGNRRWAADQGSSTAHGHRAGAQRIENVLGWCQEAGVEVLLHAFVTGATRRDERVTEIAYHDHGGSHAIAARDRKSTRLNSSH